MMILRSIFRTVFGLHAGKFLATLAAIPLCHLGRAQVYEKVFDFTDARAADAINKGRAPLGALVQGRDGNFYGTTSYGGASDLGTAFKVTPAGMLTTLVSFSDGLIGRIPQAGFVQDSDGNFYGTISATGTGAHGRIFRLTPGGEPITLATFTGNSGLNRGRNPSAVMVRGSDGNFYGTTLEGGTNNYGTVFKTTPEGTLTTLVDFSGNGVSNKGASPQAGLVQGSDGNFYGTTERGGMNDLGTVFKVTPAGELTTLVEFTGNGASNKGARPYGGLVPGSNGKFYGTTANGGTNDLGTVFKMTPGGVLTTLVSFTGNGTANKGSNPRAGLVQGSDGNFYGTTLYGGTNNYGTVFRVAPEGGVATLVNFTGNGGPNQGSYPVAALVQGSDGSFYGTTGAGGTNDYGTIFRMTPGGALTTLASFTGNGVSSKGSSPRAGLVQGGDGTFYGTTYSGGANRIGTVFQMTPGGELTTLVDFTGNGASNKGREPLAGLVRGSDGNFYGTTSAGGIYNSGTVFKMKPGSELTTLVNFNYNGVSNKGLYPYAELIQGSNGNFYGTTANGGANDLGTVFTMTPAGVLTTLVEFTGNGASNKGSRPLGSLVQSSDGSFLGTTASGGDNNLGTVFKMMPGGELTTLVNFTGNGASNKGASPHAGLVQGTDGNFYGTTQLGGMNGAGTIFQMTPTGELTTLVHFNDSNGRLVEAGLVMGGDGNFYGTTYLGGASGKGTVFRMTSAGVFTTIKSFLGSLGGDGPYAELTAAADGTLYGTTSGGATGDGTIFRLIFPGAPVFFATSAPHSDTSSAVVEARVNPRGSATDVALEYGIDSGTFSNSVPVFTGLSGYQTKVVGTTLSDLSPGTTYYYRFNATSSAGTTLSPVQSFSTLAEPVVVATPASSVTPTSAQFNGTVNARNFATTVAFEWGTDGNSFPNSAPAMTGTVTGNAPVAVSAVAGFAEGSTIYFRVRATNAAGTVISGARAFNSGLGVTTSALGDGDIGVADVTFRATVNTFGQTAQVKFKYWAESAPAVVLETSTQTVTSNGPKEVSARVSDLAENTSYSYRASVELAGTETDGGAVQFKTDTNEAPVAVADLVFYAGQVVVDPLANDTDPNEVTNLSLKLDPNLVMQPSASLVVASVTSDLRSISYNPQFSVNDDDALMYRVVDPQGASSDAQVRLIAFSKRAGLYGGRMSFGAGETRREGAVAVQMGSGGAITTSFMNWSSEGFVLKGVFDQRGRFTRTLNSSTGAVLTITLVLDPDAPAIHGSFEERVGNTITAEVPSFRLIRNADTGGLVASGLRTGFLTAPTESAGVMGDGYIRMSIGKDRRRGARFAGRLPDGEPFLAGAPAQGRSYSLAKALEQGGVITGLVRTIEGADGGGMMGNLLWKKKASARARYGRGGVQTILALGGVGYPTVARGNLPPIGLGTTNPNARMSFSGGNLGGSYRDVLVNVLPGSVKIVGPDPAQTGADLSLSKLQVKVDVVNAGFSGRFLHPETGKMVSFEGALRVPFDMEPGQGRGNFRGPSTAGSVRIIVP